MPTQHEYKTEILNANIFVSTHTNTYVFRVQYMYLFYIDTYLSIILYLAI